MNNRYLYILWILIWGISSSHTSYAQQSFSTITPKNGDILKNNMPTLTWEPIRDALCYEIWLNNIKMDEVSGECNYYTTFPLSFGSNNWKIIAITSRGQLVAEGGSFTVNDSPISEMPEDGYLIRENWNVKSFLETIPDGSIVSTPDFQTDGWAMTSVPATVLTALVRNGIYPNPYIATNNMKIPDCNDAFNQEYGLLKYSHILNTNPWKTPYWFRNEFVAPNEFEGNTIWLNFGEINYQADVWMNGKKVAHMMDMVGMERRFRFDVTKIIKKGEKNVLAVAIYPPAHPGKPAPEPLTPLADPGTNMADGVISQDYTKWDVMGWDWQPSIRDRDMGITEDVYLSATDKIEIDNLYVTSDLQLPDTTIANVCISGDIVNRSERNQSGTLQVNLLSGEQNITFSYPYTVDAGQTFSFCLTPENYTDLCIRNPKLWWPFGYGQQHLYDVVLTTSTDAGEKSIAKTKLGIRKVETYIGKNERIYKINGRDIYCKGGNWVIDMMLNWTSSRYDKEIRLTKNANLNILRVWGPTGVPPKAFFDAADREGVLIWQDFLNDYWGTFCNKDGFQPEIGLYEKVTTDVIKKYRNHPSLVIWCGGNEGNNPREDMIVNKLLPKYDGRDSRSYLRASSEDGLHGGGPYHTLPPKEYFTMVDNLSGFSSEIGPSGVPIFESVKRFIPEVGQDCSLEYFPIDGTWAYHDANDWPGEDTRKFSSYDCLVRSFYGDVERDKIGVRKYLEKCQLLNYDVYRASIEAINHQLWNTSSGILLWKSNSSWPSLTWQIYDWYLQPHAGFYGTKKAATLEHIQLNRHNNTITALNLTPQKMQATIKANLYSMDMKLCWSEQETLMLDENMATLSSLVIPESEEVQILKLELYCDKRFISDNYYWLHKNNQFEKLQEIPNPVLKVHIVKREIKDQWNYKITVKNAGKTLAYMTRFQLAGAKSGIEILPTFWTDNYLTLLPGETKTIEAFLDKADILETPVLLYNTYSHSMNRIEIK